MSFQLAPKAFWWTELISQFFCYSNSSKNITCLTGKLKTEFTSPITKSTSRGLLNTAFFACWRTDVHWCMGTEHDDNVFSPTDLNLLNWSSVEFQIFLPHQKTSHCRLLTWIQEELHMQLTKHTSMVVYMFLHFINLKFLRYKINTKESWKKNAAMKTI